VVTAFVDSGDKIVQNIQNGIFLTFIEDTERLQDTHDISDSSFEVSSSEPSQFYQSLINPQKKESMESIIGSVSNLVHAILLFPFSQPITPYVMSKRKKTIKRSARAHLNSKRPLRYISTFGVLEPFDDYKSKIQEFLISMGEQSPFELEDIFESTEYIIHFYSKGYLLVILWFIYQFHNRIILIDKENEEVDDYIEYERAKLEENTEEEKIVLTIQQISNVMNYWSYFLILYQEGKFGLMNKLEAKEIVLLQQEDEEFKEKIRGVYNLFTRE